MDKEINSRLMTWVIGHDTGLSSLTLWAAIMNVQNYNADIPHDNSDFGRCYRMLNDSQTTVGLKTRSMKNKADE